MKTAILLVAYGTSSPQGRGSLRQFDAWVRERFPGICVRWALSSELLRTRLTRARQKNDSVLKALRRLCLENFTHVAVQPLQIIPGSEHTDVRADADEAGRLDGLHVSIGTPLLACDEDIRAAAQAVLAHLPEERRADEDVVLMGHGSRKQAVTAYAALAGAVQALDARVHVGTMSGALELEALLPRLTSRRVWLMPLLSVVGRHTLEDMAGDAPDSWRSRIEAAGHTCAPVVRGTAEYRAFADIWLRHLEDAVAALPTVKQEEEKRRMSCACRWPCWSAA